MVEKFEFHHDDQNQLEDRENVVRSLKFFEQGVKMEVNGHSLEITGYFHKIGKLPRMMKFFASSGTIDGSELSAYDLNRIMEKFSDYITDNLSKDRDNDAVKKAISTQNELRTKNEAAVEDVLK
jgi:hypothetical protein